MASVMPIPNGQGGFSFVNTLRQTSAPARFLPTQKAASTCKKESMPDGVKYLYFPLPQGTIERGIIATSAILPKTGFTARAYFASDSVPLFPGATAVTTSFMSALNTAGLLADRLDANPIDPPFTNHLAILAVKAESYSDHLFKNNLEPAGNLYLDCPIDLENAFVLFSSHLNILRTLQPLLAPDNKTLFDQIYGNLLRTSQGHDTLGLRGRLAGDLNGSQQAVIYFFAGQKHTNDLSPESIKHWLEVAANFFDPAQG